MTRIHYLVGDATKPVSHHPNEVRYIMHCCNDKDAWGAGFVVALNRVSKEPKRAYHQMRKKLGNISLAQVNDNTYVFNIVGQQGYGRKKKQYVKYNALRKGFSSIAKELTELQQSTKNTLSVHAPRLGAGLAGGEWAVIEQMIKEEIVEQGFDVYIYDLPRR